jgi:hypothetical protein
MSITSLSTADSATLAQKLQKQAQTASNAANQLAQQIQQQAQSAAPAATGWAQPDGAPQRAGHAGPHNAGTTANAAAGIAQSAEAASGVNQLA